jgi:hypothetical protein
MHIDGEPGVFLEIPRLGQTVFVIFHEEGQGIPREQKEGLALKVAFSKITPELAGVGLEIKKYVQQSSKDGKKHDGEYPG